MTRKGEKLNFVSANDSTFNNSIQLSVYNPQVLFKRELDCNLKIEFSPGISLPYRTFSG